MADYFGTRIRRREDPRLLTGRGCYVDDIVRPGMLYCAFARSEHVHARIVSIKVHFALALPGVVSVLTFADLERWMLPLPLFGGIPPMLGERVNMVVQQAQQYPLVKDVARYVGECLAIVVAENAAAAQAGVEAIEVQYESLPAVTDVLHAEMQEAPRIHPQWDSNVAVAFKHSIGDPERVFQEAELVLRETFTVHRSAGMPLEPRGVLAEYDRGHDAVTTWSSTQIPHVVQQHLVEVFSLAPHKVRVVAPDVGGGFGTKVSCYPEDVLVPLAARLLGRPVKWSENRREHFTASAHARDQVHRIELAARHDGLILGIRDALVIDLGAYNPWGIVLPYNSVAHLLGPYRVPHLAVDVKALITNKVPNAPYRGAGRPEVVFAIERGIDCLAHELGLDPANVRHKNMILAQDMPYDVGLPYRDGHPLIYDSGDFPATLEASLLAAEYQAFRAEQQSLRTQHVYRGIGLAAYVEGTGIGPYESASVQLDAAGHVVVATGAASQGQGHETVFAQLAADALDVPLAWVAVTGGDTGLVPFGVGTYASRSAVAAGASIMVASAEVRRKVVDAAARLFEVAPEDIVLTQGTVAVHGVPGSAIPLGQLIRACLPTFAQAGVVAPDFAAHSYQHPPTVTYSNAVHVAKVEVDVETGFVQLLEYVVAHDCGRVINPLIVEGQIHGGVVQGIGGGLWEELVYTDDGQLLTGSFLDYALPVATRLPTITTVHLESPSPLNPLGIKGVGEGGAIAPAAALANALEDALAPFGVRVTHTPMTAPRIFELLHRESRREPAV
jgi:aerobic carbon-monoxide dehydrogenase large subunit